MWGDPTMHDSPPPADGGFGFGGGPAAETDPDQVASCMYQIQGVTFYLKPRYKPQLILGRGAFGIVW